MDSSKSPEVSMMSSLKISKFSKLPFFEVILFLNCSKNYFLLNDQIFDIFSDQCDSFFMYYGAPNFGHHYTGVIAHHTIEKYRIFRLTRYNTILKIT